MKTSLVYLHWGCTVWGDEKSRFELQGDTKFSEHRRHVSTRAQGLFMCVEGRPPSS
jgi:hypothetical protein